eukprot:5244242-Heterocapsa_arctica.AAC.1
MTPMRASTYASGGGRGIRAWRLARRATKSVDRQIYEAFLFRAHRELTFVTRWISELADGGPSCELSEVRARISE